MSLCNAGLEKKTAATRQPRDELARKGLADQGSGEKERERECVADGGGSVSEKHSHAYTCECRRGGKK